MAYENMTYEVILQRMLDRVSDKYPGVDTREGSILFNALAPAAIELAIAYSELDNVLGQSFVATASRDYLYLACEQIGMNTSGFDSTAGEHKGEFNALVPIGSRWNHDLYNYEVVEYLGLEGSYHTYRMVCETEGVAPNVITGDLSPITELSDNLVYAKVTECIIEGKDETSDEEIRNAYFEFVNSTIAHGNINDYKNWCNIYKGVGNSKVIPLWNGANTVKVSILSESNGVASDELIAEFQEYLDPDVSGMGDGAAPIGAFVTVTTATEVPMNMTGTVTMKNGYSDTEAIDNALTEYFQSIAYEKTQVAYMNLGAIILNVEGVESVSNLTVNGETADITIGDEEIAVLGTTNWTVI